MFALRRALPLLAMLACAAAPSGCAVDEGDVASEDDPFASTKLFVRSISSAKTYESVAVEGGGFGQAGRTMKFLIDGREKGNEAPYFINGNFKVSGKVPDYAKYHYLFGRRAVGVTEDNTAFNDATYFAADKRYFAGTIQTYSLSGQTAPLYAFQFYPDDVIAEGEIVRAARALVSSFRIPKARFAFVATGPQQTTTSVKAELTALGVETTTLDALLGSVRYFPMNAGEAWGTLRIFPKDYGELRATDIPVFDELPLDLSVVAGTITRTYQDATSHVNLKSKERGTPNMVLRDASPTTAELAPFADKPVHLVVGKQGFLLEPTTKEIVEKKLSERLAKPWVPLRVVDESRLMSYDDMCPKKSGDCMALVPRFGGKSVGLGFLANKDVMGRAAQSGTFSQRVGYDMTPRGFGVPVADYRAFVALPGNEELRAAIDALIAGEKKGALSPNERRATIEKVQRLVLVAKLDPERLAAIRAQLAVVLPGINKIKIRSSSNAEDVPGFDGAGLYDSYAAKVDTAEPADGVCVTEPDPEAPTKSKIKPKSVGCIIKGVYASLWNRRAVEERTFARVDHATSGMGLSVVPVYDSEDDIAANAVVVTRAINADGLLAYTVSSQRENNLVTNPDPGTLAETSLATFAAANRPPRFTVARYATPVAGGPQLTLPVLPEAKMKEIVEAAKKVEIAYCRAVPAYYPGGDCRSVWLDGEKPAALDMELKVLANGHLILKQNREFHGR